MYIYVLSLHLLRSQLYSSFIFTDRVDNLEFYTFFGRLIALALMHRVQVGATLNPIMVLMLAELDVTMEHVQNSDPFLYRTMNKQVNIQLNSALPDLLDQLPQDQKDNKEVADKLEADITREYWQTLMNDVIEPVAKKIASIREGIDYIFGPLRRRVFFRTMETSHLDMVICGDPEDLSVGKSTPDTRDSKEMTVILPRFGRL